MRIVWLAIGVGATGCGIAGIVLPLVPTTPFLLLAAYAFARSSPALHDWLVSHPRLGPPIEHWHTHGAISYRTKSLAIAAMLSMFIVSWAAGLGTTLLLVQAAALAGAAIFILSRPSAPRRDS
jgi:uncharacterized membrane protein YbaN (DUF454 family)